MFGLALAGLSAVFSFATLLPRPPRPPFPFPPPPHPFPRPQGCTDNSLGSVVFVGFRAGRVSISGGGAGRGTGGVTALDDCAAGVAGGGAAVEDGGTGTGMDAGVDIVSVNDAMMAVAAKLLHGDVVRQVS